MNENRGIWRGKRKVYHNDETNKDVFEWVEGFPIKMWGAVHLQDKEDENLAVPVDPETLGECTGQLAKNSKLAFEGDLVKAEYIDAIGVIRYGEYRQPFNDHKSTKHIGFYIDWLEENNKSNLRVDLGYWLQLVEIIGNIHDNPELIQKGAAE